VKAAPKVSRNTPPRSTSASRTPTPTFAHTDVRRRYRGPGTRRRGSH
jgi:hypothetical protein